MVVALILNTIVQLSLNSFLAGREIRISVAIGVNAYVEVTIKRTRQRCKTTDNLLYLALPAQTCFQVTFVCFAPKTDFTLTASRNK